MGSKTSKNRTAARRLPNQAPAKGGALAASGSSKEPASVKAKVTVPPMTKASLESYPIHGIHTTYLLKLAEEHPEWASKNIYTLVRELVKPQTNEKQSWVAKLGQDEATKQFITPKADAFLSYAWKMSLTQILQALDGRSLFIWMDCFCLDQHIHQTISPEELTGVFRMALKEIGTVLVMGSPWKQPLVTTRIWCVLEQCVAAELDLKVELVLSKDEVEDFRRALMATIDFAAFQSMFGAVNMTNAEAEVTADRDTILLYLTEVGALKVNDLTMLPWKAWMIKTVREFEFEEGAKETGYASYSIGCLFHALVSDR